MPKAVTAPTWSSSRGRLARSVPSSWHRATRPLTGKSRLARERRRPTSSWWRSRGKKPRSGWKIAPAGHSPVWRSTARWAVDLLRVTKLMLLGAAGLECATWGWTVGQTQGCPPDRGTFQWREGRPGLDLAPGPAANPRPRDRHRRSPGAQHGRRPLADFRRGGHRGNAALL